MQSKIFSKFFFLALGVAASAQASDIQSLKCEHDMRPVDGPYQALELVQNEDGRYDVYFEVKTAGFGSPVQETRVQIAKNLGHCNIAKEDARILACYKSASEEGEPTNSGFESTLVKKTSVGPKGTLISTSTIGITVYSPQLHSEAGTVGFPYMENPGHAEFEFAAEKNGSFMINRCTVSK